MTKFSQMLAATSLLALLPLSPATARPMTAQDLATFARVGDSSVSPDGRWVVYQQTDTDPATYARTTGLWRVSVTAPGTPERVADIAGADESSPTFSANGRQLYFLSSKSGHSQLWVASVGADGQIGTPVQASDLPSDVDGYMLDPTGARVLIWGAIADGCPTFGCPPPPSAGGSARFYNDGAGFVRHWDQWTTPGVHNHLYTATLGADGHIAGAVTAIAPELIGHTPGQPFGGRDEISWSRDGRTIYFAMRLADRHEPTSTNLDIYAAPSSGGAATNLTVANLATDTLPAVSPDGRTLAYVAMARAGYEADRQVLMLRDLTRGTVRALTANWDRSVESIEWTADSKALIVTTHDTLEVPAYRIDARTGAQTRLTERGSVSDVHALRGGGMVYAINSITAPADLVAMDGRGATRPLTHANAARLADIDPVDYSQYSFIGANGDRVYGQILAPRGSTGKLPTVLMVHGGPQGSLNNSWSFRWNPMLWASQGIALVSVDFHGSTGYGQAFTDSINRNWGGWPLEDLRLGFAAAAREDGRVDTSNACAAGASYGGYMMNWIEGQWRDGFKCLVQHDGVFDARAMAYETDELWFDEWEHGGPYFTHATEFERWNPVNHVDQWQTPMLVITGEKDFRIPYTQGLAAFTALQRRGIPSQLLVFPDENHWVLKGANSVRWHQTVFDWIHRWTGPGATIAAPASTGQ